MASDSMAARVGHGLAKLLGIKLHYRNPQGLDDVSRGESVYSVSSADTYVEQEPSTGEWIRSIIPTGRGMLRWAYNLFPFVHWIGRYNLQWLSGDLVAGKLWMFREEVWKINSLLGITVGCVVVPQSMAYARLAELAPEYGLYSSFMGVLIYWFFATSKDITIGVSAEWEASRLRTMLMLSSPSLSCLP